MHSSTLYSVGTALRRAETNCLPVEVLVDGHWLSGNVAGVDGHGVILTTHSEHCVVRLESICAVRIPETVPDAPVAETFDELHHELTVAHLGSDEEAWAMPGPINA
jgi:hypothetical protein